MEEEGTLKDEIKKLNENISKLADSKKVKDLKLKGTPSKAKVKKGYIYVIYIRENGEIDPKAVEVEEGTTMIDGIPRIAAAPYRLNYKGKPAIILPAWSVEPFNPLINYDETIRNQMTSQGFKLLLNRIELGAIKAKGKMSGFVIFIIVIALIIGGYLLLS